MSNSPFSLFYAMNFDHGITYVAIYLDTLTCLFLHTRLLKAHTKLLEAHTRLLETLSLSLSVMVNGFWPPSEEGGLLAVPTECDSC